jgi:hypothetical protein
LHALNRLVEEPAGVEVRVDDERLPPPPQRLVAAEEVVEDLHLVVHAHRRVVQAAVAVVAVAERRNHHLEQPLGPRIGVHIPQAEACGSETSGQAGSGCCASVSREAHEAALDKYRRRRDPG